MGLNEQLPRFAKAYRNLRKEISDGVKEWALDVSAGNFPSEAESFH
jgi:3-methyl-2-oxobutanoate hydroxymethyltransferase